VPAVTPQTKAALRGLTWIGGTPAIQLARTQVWEAAPTDLPVLFLGAPGSGRQLAAHILHALGLRQERPFIRVDCKAIPPSQAAAVLFEGTPASPAAAAPLPRASALALADGGTLFLDGLEYLPVDVQQELLRHIPRPSRLHTGSPAGIRIVAAAQTGLQQQARTGTFCAPLFYRLAILPVHLPPLCRRGGDLSLLATHFYRHTRVRTGRGAQALPKDVLDTLYRHDWTGGVWALKRFCERAALVPGQEPIDPDRAARLLEVAPWEHEVRNKPVSKWTSPWRRRVALN